MSWCAAPLVVSATRRGWLVVIVNSSEKWLGSDFKSASKGNECRELDERIGVCSESYVETDGQGGRRSCWKGNGRSEYVLMDPTLPTISKFGPAGDGSFMNSEGVVGTLWGGQTALGSTRSIGSQSRPHKRER